MRNTIFTSACFLLLGLTNFVVAHHLGDLRERVHQLEQQSKEFSRAEQGERHGKD